MGQRGRGKNVGTKHQKHQGWTCWLEAQRGLLCGGMCLLSVSLELYWCPRLWGRRELGLLLLVCPLPRLVM